MKVYHVIKGEVTCQDVADIFGCKIGDPEYQFSDGEPGGRTVSYDFKSIEDGINALSPAVFLINQTR